MPNWEHKWVSLLSSEESMRLKTAIMSRLDKGPASFVELLDAACGELGAVESFDVNDCMDQLYREGAIISDNDDGTQNAMFEKTNYS